MTDRCPRKWTLVELPGVGRKTANVVLGTAYGIAVRRGGRYARRPDQPPAWDSAARKTRRRSRQDLMGQFAEKEWIALSHRMIQHGRRCCTARSPKCDECPLESLCPKIGVEK